MLYIVATPIGNLQDFSYRAIEILRHVDAIMVEDTRRAHILFQHYIINRPLILLHQHNETKVIENVIKLLQAGQNLALISDAGTPLISDPGSNLVKAAHLAKIVVSPIPGASAVIAALSVSGIAMPQFRFEGFLPSKLGAKQRFLADLKHETITLVFFEAPHRISETLKVMLEVFGGDRKVTFCREISKKFETIIETDLAKLYEIVTADQTNHKGEIVLVVAGSSKVLKKTTGIDAKVHTMLEILASEMPLAKATKILAKISGIAREELYNYWISFHH